MATEDVPAKKTECDGCGRTFWQEAEAEEPVHGYHGWVSHITAMGGTGANWFACGVRCIRKAIENAIEKSLQ